MLSENLLLDLVGLIYDAAGNPARWPIFLEKFADAVKTTTTVLVVYDVEARNGSLTSTIRFDPEYQRKYDEYYSGLDCFAAHGSHLLTTGRVSTGQMLCPDRVLERSEFHNDFLKRMDVFHEMAGCIFKDRSVVSVLSTLRPKRAGPLGEEHAALLQALMPHLQRALQLHRRIVGLEAKAMSMTDVLDRLPTGCITVSATGKVLMVNRQARAIIDQDDGFGMNRERLCAKRHVDTTRLQQLIQQAGATALGKGMHPGGVMMIVRPSQHRPFEILVTPLRSGPFWLGMEHAVAAVFISDPESKAESPYELLGRIFGLTPAEAGLAGKLMQGMSLKESAEELGVTRNTVHSQLQRIFEKTGTNRQADLVRSLLSSPAHFLFR